MAAKTAFEGVGILASSYGVVALLLTFAIILIGRHLIHVDFDPREPPVIPHWFPSVGHLGGMLRYGAKYYEIIYHKYHYPIFTLQTLNSRMYIVTSPALAGIIQRSSKSWSFYKATNEFSRRFAALDETTMKLVRDNMDGGTGAPGVLPETHDMTHKVLASGSESLNSVTGMQLDLLAEALNESEIADNDGAIVEMHDWVRQLVSQSNAHALYGPQNPFKTRPELVKDFWEFEDGLIPLLVDVFPALTARKAHRARQKLFDELVDYVKKEKYKFASELIQHRIRINLTHGFTPEKASQAELTMLWAIVSNAVPTTFWVILNIFSRLSLLDDLRKEVANAVTEESKTRIIDVSFLKSSCPLLISTYRETLRTASISTSIRMTLEDTTISDRYLLKKDSVILIAGALLHTSKDIWGSDADTFKPQRFISVTTSSTTPSETPLPNNNSLSVENKPSTATLVSLPVPKNVPRVAFRAFGGGSVVCPGQYFAQSEIVGVAAALLLGFDITTPSGGLLDLPKMEEPPVALTVKKPAEKCHVRIRRREGMEGVRWVFKL